jgi:hypothetical protein
MGDLAVTKYRIQGWAILVFGLLLMVSVPALGFIVMIAGAVWLIRKPKEEEQ